MKKRSIRSFVLELWRGMLTLTAVAGDLDFSEDIELRYSHHLPTHDWLSAYIFDLYYDTIVSPDPEKLRHTAMPKSSQLSHSSISRRDRIYAVRPS